MGVAWGGQHLQEGGPLPFLAAVTRCVRVTKSGEGCVTRDRPDVEGPELARNLPPRLRYKQAPTGNGGPKCVDERPINRGNVLTQVWRQQTLGAGS